MIRWLIGVGLRARVAILALAFVAILAGLIQLRSSTVDVFPEFDPPLVEVQTEALGLSAAEVESLITVPLEADLLNGVAWLDEIRSESVAGLSSIVLEFEPGTDPIRARQMVQERLTQAHALPNVSKPPVMLQPLSSNSRVMMVGLSSDDMSLVDLGVLARWNIKPRLLGVPGVANVAVWGHRDRQLQVLVDPASLNQAGVTLDQVVETTGEALWVSPLTFLESSKPGTGGWIDTPNQRLGIRHLLPIASPEDLEKVPVVDDPDLLIGDIARVTESHQQLIGDALIDGDPGMILVIERFPDADPVAVTEDVETTLRVMRAGLPGVDIDTELFRPAGYVESMTSNLATALGIGLLLALVALALFLRSWRTALIGLVVIVTSLSVAVLVLDWRGETLNLMTIAGLIIALAILVDEVIVDTDAVTRRLRAARDAGETGSTRSAIFFAGTETRRAVLTATAILILVVVPVFFLPGLSGTLFSSLAVSYIVAVVAAFVVAMLVTPALSSLLLNDVAQVPEPASDRLLSIHDRVTGAVGRISGTALLGLAVVLAAVTVATVALMDRSWTPTFQQDAALVKWEAEPGTSPSVMLDTIRSATDELSAIDGVVGVSAHIGRAETGDRTVNVNSAELWVQIDDDDRAASVEAIERVSANLPGSAAVSQTFIPERLDEALNGEASDLTVRVYGVDLQDIDAKAREIAEVVDVVDGVSSATVDDQVLEPQLNVTVRLDQAERFGILPGDVRRQATTLISGLQVGSLFEEQKVFDVVVWAQPELRDETDDFEALLIDLPDGSQVALSELATIETVDAPLNIRRDAVSRFADVEVLVDGRGAGAVADDIESALLEVSFSQESRAEILGQATEAGGQGRLALLLAAVVIGIYLLIQAAFGGWRLAAGVMIAVLAALTGGLIGAAILGAEMTLAVAFGLLAVAGLTVRHALLVIDRARTLELDAVDIGPEQIREATRERVPAVVASVVVTALLVLPSLLLGNAPGLEILRPMAVVMLFGLVTSLPATMVVVPAVYERFRVDHDPDDPIDLRTPDDPIDVTASNGDRDPAVEGEPVVAGGGTDAS